MFKTAQKFLPVSAIILIAISLLFSVPAGAGPKFNAPASVPAQQNTINTPPTSSQYTPDYWSNHDLYTVYPKETKDHAIAVTADGSRVIIFVIDKTGNLLYANPTPKQIYGGNVPFTKVLDGGLASAVTNATEVKVSVKGNKFYVVWKDSNGVFRFFIGEANESYVNSPWQAVSKSTIPISPDYKSYILSPPIFSLDGSPHIFVTYGSARLYHFQGNLSNHEQIQWNNMSNGDPRSCAVAIIGNTFFLVYEHYYYGAGYNGTYGENTTYLRALRGEIGNEDGSISIETNDNMTFPKDGKYVNVASHGGSNIKFNPILAVSGANLYLTYELYQPSQKELIFSKLNSSSFGLAPYENAPYFKKNIATYPFDSPTPPQYSMVANGGGLTLVYEYENAGKHITDYQYSTNAGGTLDKDTKSLLTRGGWTRKPQLVADSNNDLFFQWASGSSVYVMMNDKVSPAVTLDSIKKYTTAWFQKISPMGKYINFGKININFTASDNIDTSIKVSGKIEGPGPTIVIPASDSSPIQNINVSGYDGKTIKISLAAYDDWGNKGSSPVKMYTVDLTPPVTTAEKTPPNPNANGWYKEGIKIALSASDATSGVKGIHYKVEGGDSDGAWNDTSSESNTNDIENKTISVGQLKDGQYTISYYAEDIAGNKEAITKTIFNVDKKAPNVSITTPQKETSVSVSKVSYTLSEDCATGKVSWERLAGAEDNTPHVNDLTANELKAGSSIDLDLNFDPPLKNGAIYKVTIMVTDPAGNQGVATINDVAYDTVALNPEFEKPAKDGVDNDPIDVEYSLPEKAKENTVKLTFAEAGTSLDSNDPHVYVDPDSSIGKHAFPLDKSTLALVDGATYDVKLEYQDLAGNSASVTNTGFTYDTTAPKITKGTLDTSNAYVDIEFSEGVYKYPDKALTNNSFDISFNKNGGSATGVLKGTVTKTNGDSLVGGETIVRMNLNVSGTPNGLETLTIKPNKDADTIFDKAHNPATTDGVTVYLNDQTVCTVTKVSAVNDGYFKAGDEIIINMEFSENVLASGAPRLKLETGGIDQYAAYEGGSGNTLNFKYTVQPGDTSPDLNYVSINSLELNGGTIKAASKDATLTLPITEETGSLGKNNSIVIDTQAPAVTYVLNPALPDGDNGWYSGSSVTFTLTAVDSGYSGVKKTSYTLNGGIPYSENDASVYFNLAAGENNITYWAEDHSGNISTSGQRVVKRDNIKPTGSIEINGGSDKTSTNPVTLHIQATDANSGVAFMQVRNDTSWDNSWIACDGDETINNWLLPGTYGYKTVYVKFKDLAGNISSAYSDQIDFDANTPVTPTVANISPAVMNYGETPAVTITGTNFISGKTTVKIGPLALANVAVANATTITATVPSGLSVGKYDVVVTVDGQVGTLTNGFEVKPVVPSMPTNVSISRDGVTALSSVTVSWQTAPNAHSPVKIYAKTGAFSAVATGWSEISAPTIVPNGNADTFTDPSQVKNGIAKYYKIIPAGQNLQNGDLTSNIVGKFDLTIGEGSNLISLPLVPASNDINAVIGDQLKRGAGPTTADKISYTYYDPNSATYVTSQAFLNSLGLWQGSLTIEPDKGYSVTRQTGAGSTFVTVVGSLFLGNTRNISLTKDSNMIGTVYPVSVPLNSANLAGVLTPGTVLNADKVNYYDNQSQSMQSAYLGSDGLFHSANLTSLEPGKGYYVNNQALVNTPNPDAWSYTRP